MVKEDLIALVRDWLSGGSAPASLRGKYHSEVIARYLEMTFNDLIFEAYAQGLPSNDFSQVDNYIQRYEYTIQYNKSTNEKYIQLTVQPVPLPNNFSIRQVSAWLDQVNVVFAPIDTTAQPVFNALEVSRISTVPAYIYEGSKIYFDNSYPYGLEKLMVKMIVGFGELSDTDQVFVPGGNNTVVFQKVCEIMSREQPKINQDNLVDKQV